MATHAQRRERRDAFAAALKERDGAERYQLRQRKVRRGTAATLEAPRPYAGVPIPRPIPGMVRRAARLLRQR